MVDIVQKGHKVLRQIATPIPKEEITSSKIRSVIKRMKEALDSQDDGVAIAAPQIGEPLRIFIVSKRVESILAGDDVHKKSAREGQDIVYINPQITKLSKKKHSLDEGCLSVRYLYGKVERADKATIKAYDERGKLFTEGASGLLAQIFQHETDHLDGILFIDKATDLVDMPPETSNK